MWCLRGGEEQKRQCIQQEKETDAFLFEQKETKRNVFCVGGGCSRYLNFYFSFSFCYCYFCAPFLPVLSWTAGCFSRGVVTVMGESVE